VANFDEVENKYMVQEKREGVQVCLCVSRGDDAISSGCLPDKRHGGEIKRMAALFLDWSEDL